MGWVLLELSKPGEAAPYFEHALTIRTTTPGDPTEQPLRPRARVVDGLAGNGRDRVSVSSRLLEFGIGLLSEHVGNFIDSTCRALNRSNVREKLPHHRVQLQVTVRLSYRPVVSVR